MLKKSYSRIHFIVSILQASESIVHYLEPSTRKPLIGAVEQKLLAPHIKSLLDKGFDSLMDETRIDDLHRMYQLYLRVEKGLDEMRVAFNAYARKRGAEIVGDEARDKEMVDDLLTFKAKCDTLLEKAFLKGETFAYSLRDAFEFILNVRQVRSGDVVVCMIFHSLTNIVKSVVVVNRIGQPSSLPSSSIRN